MKRRSFVLLKGAEGDLNFVVWLLETRTSKLLCGAVDLTLGDGRGVSVRSRAIRLGDPAREIRHVGTRVCDENRGARGVFVGDGEKRRSVAEPWLFDLGGRMGGGAGRAQGYTRENQTITNGGYALFVSAKVTGFRASRM